MMTSIAPPTPPPKEDIPMAKAFRLSKYWSTITSDDVNVNPAPTP